MSEKLSGRFRITNNDQIRRHAENTSDPRHVFYEAMLSCRTYDEYLAKMESVTVQPKTTAYKVTGAMEIRYCRSKLGWIADA